MRSGFIMVLSAVTVLTWSGRADALSPETACEVHKLHASGVYAKCLARVGKAARGLGGDHIDSAIERCDARFDRSFERAEAEGGCRTAGGPVTLRGPIKKQAADTFAAITAGNGCPSTPVLENSTYVCTLKSNSAVDLAAIIDQINSASVTINTVVWIEAWGADGGHGNTSNGGSGGTGGYAQMTTTVSDLLLFFGTSEIYYYLGMSGTSGANAGGDGGTGTMVSLADLTTSKPSFRNQLLLAGGGGGGGGGRGTSSACGDPGNLDVLGGSGGAGGEAISQDSTDAFGAGGKGGARRNKNFSGSGGGGDSAGSGGAVNGSGNPKRGDGGFAALGGVGGGHTDPTIGFFNQSGIQVMTSGGEGGHPGDDAGGGGGGGGYGGGGGGSEGDGTTGCVSGGGGGGGGFATASAKNCTRSRAPNPNASRGAVQIVFDAGSCG